MRTLCTFFMVAALLIPLQGQQIKKQEAKEYFMHQRYADAMAVLGSARDLVRNDAEAKFLLAISHYQLYELGKAEELFKELIEEDKDTYPECWLYLGRLYHAQHRFEKGAAYYKDYLRRLKPNHPNRKMVWDAISRCAVGMRLQYEKTDIVVENLGPAVNTVSDEFAPVLSPNNSNKLYFSSIRPGNTGGLRNRNGLPDTRLGSYYSDIYSCQQQSGTWSSVEALPYLLNSPQHELLLGFNTDGSVLYYYQGWAQQNGAIYVDTFRNAEERRLSSDPFQGPLNTAWGDGQPFFVNDTLVYFSSRRPGGFGGLDLYKSTYTNNQWQQAENLGPTINTAYDECTPYMARNGLTLYFSSNHSHRSIGGLDVLKAVYNERSRRWTVPENVGIPVNSAADDAYFRIARDGYTAFFSSARKDGYGQRDIYIGYFNSFLPEMELPLAAFQPTVTPSRKQETITQKPQDLAFEPVAYEQTLPAPPEPSVTTETVTESSDAFLPVRLDGPSAALSKDQQEQFRQIAEYLKEYSDLQLVITAFHKPTGKVGTQLFEGIKTAERARAYLIEQGVKSSSIFLRSVYAENAYTTSLNFSFFKPEDFPPDIRLSDMETDKYLAIPDHVINNNLIYKVQVFSLKGASKSSILEKYDHPMVEKTDGLAYYRYTLGAFDNFAEAEAFRKRMVALREKSAFVVPYIYGLRADMMMAKRNIINFPDLKDYTESTKKP